MKRLFRKLSMFFAFGAMIFGSGLVANEVVSNSNRHNVVARAAENEYYTVTANTTAGAENNFTFTWKDTAYKVSKAPTKEDCSVSIGSIANFELIKLTDTYLQVNIITGAEAERDVSIILHTDNGDYKLTMSIVGGSYSDSCTVESVACNHESEGGDTGEDKPVENEYYTVTANTTSGAANNFTFTWKDTAYKVSKAPTKEDCSVSVGIVTNLEFATLSDNNLQVNIITGAEKERDVSIILHTDNGDYKLTMSIVSGSYSGNCTVESVACNHESNEEIIANVVSKIDAIGTVEFTSDCKKLIDEARKAYDELDESLKSSVTNYETLTAAEAEYERLLNETDFDTKPISIDATKTKVDGAGIHIYLSDKPNLSIDDFTMTVVSFESTQHAGDKDQIMSGITKVHYIKDQGGWLHGTIKVGLPDGHDQKMVINVTYTIGTTVYTQDLTFIGNVYQPDLSDEEKITNVIAKINAIGNVEATNASKALIDEARKAYDELDESLKSSVTNYETLTAAEAEYERLMNEADLDIRPIAIDATKTKVEGAGIHIYLSDKPNLSIDDFTMTVVSFESTQHAGDKDQIMSGITKVHYIKDQGGWLHGTIKVGLPDGHDQKMVINVTYTIGITVYTQNVTFVGNAYQANNFPTITNAEAKNLLPSTSGESTSSKYFFNGNVLEVTDETNGAFTFVDLDGNIISVASSSLLDTSYADMTSKLNNNDDVIIYGAINNKDGEVVINNAIIVSINRIAQEETFKLIEDVITVDTCKDYANSSNYRARYNALDASKQAIFNSVVINCKADKTDASLTGSVSLIDKLSYMEVLNVSESTNSEESLLNSFVSSNNISIVLVVGLLGLAAIAGYYFVNKKKYC